MKIACDACATKYSIADDKVAGKVFKIRCKKCGNVIVVRGGDGAIAEPPAVDPAETRTQDAEHGGGEAPDAGWYVVVDGAQVGPLAIADVQERLAAGAIDRDTYAWREGQDDWAPLADVPELARLLEPADVFTARGGEPAGIAVAVEPAEPVAAREPAAGAPAMRGQRSESSVLFSLGNLSSLAAGPRPAAASAPAAGAAGHGGSEGSGLIDIRSMASAYLGGKPATHASAPRIGSADDLPVFSGAAFAEPAVILPMTTARNDNRLMYVLIGSVGVIAAIAIVLLVVVLGKKDATAAPPAPAPIAQRDEVAPTAPAPSPTSPAPAPPEAAPTAPAPSPTEAAPAPTAPAPTTQPAPARAPAPPVTREPERAPRPRASTPAPAPRTPAPAPTAPGKCSLDETGCLLAARPPACCEIYRGGTRTTPTVKPPAPSDDDLAEALTPAAIKAGLATVHSKALACGARSSAKGKVQIAYKVAASGSVTSATVLESPDPALGACVATAAKRATFAKTRTGGSFKYPYHF